MRVGFINAKGKGWWGAIS